ncbi:Detected protein of confused Function [Hibiscus syriacus]|uniref:Detected protein of confused Function n=1 Tax=Hibiscus syriacus TaxID=106335 RepID=A0A6A3BDZ7_HIBSY|nr:uncharacterized protein LOC120113871 [Hibiscus syriacus]XP_038990859.1 uncharacterized protein LOC120113871 [Hibiscus syriacus]KAE8713292.1 Detected protein of confused Function [Hibiscus syriacus]
MEQENNKNKGDNVAEDLSKAKFDIAKSIAKNFLKTRNSIDTSEVQRRKRKKKNKSISESSKLTENDAKKQKTREENPQKSATSSMVNVENGKQIQKKEENTYQSGGKEKSSKSSGSNKIRRRGRGAGLLNKNWKNEEKQRGKRNRKWNVQMEKHRSSEKNFRTKEKSDGKGMQQENKMKEKIDGLIFLCNAKTKPECFRYRVMGVSNDKKDLVLGIRRGFKLFLYDYDLKLMYGVYKASSSGGIKLEPEAFGGAFPAQVRFSIHVDCFPLAESIFKKAIKENYNKNNKFKIELTARQVRKLTKLFRPAAVHSTALPVHSPPSRAVARIFEHPENGEAHDRPREARVPSYREASARDPYAYISTRSYPVLSHERDRQIAYGELPSTRREVILRDLYLNENDYGAYGFRGERRNLSFQTPMAPRLGSYHRDYKELPLHQQDVVYRESMPMQREIIPSDPLYCTKREYKTYDLGATQEMQLTVSAATANTSLAGASTLDPYATDPYYSRYYGASSFDSYLPHSNREAHPNETDRLRMRENNQVDGLNPMYASNALAEYNQRYRRHDAKPVPASTSVSYRYFFNGPSFSNR